MQAQVELQADNRAETGKGAARAVRRLGQVPVIVYGNKKNPVGLSVDENKLTAEYRKGGFMSKVVALKTEKETFFGIAREVQRNPVSDRIEHADFIHVDAKSRIKVRVPVHYLNTEKSVGLKRGGVLNMVRRQVEVYCSITSIPKSIDVDTANVNIGTSVHIEDIGLPEGVTPTINRNFVLCTITGRAKDDGENAAAAASDAAATAEKK